MKKKLILSLMIAVGVLFAPELDVLAQNDCAISSVNHKHHYKVEELKKIDCYYCDFTGQSIRVYEPGTEILMGIVYYMEVGSEPVEMTVQDCVYQYEAGTCSEVDVIELGPVVCDNIFVECDDLDDPDCPDND